MRGAVMAIPIALALGCDSSAPVGLRYCGPADECPQGQSCVDGVCGTSPDATPIDASPGDAASDAAIPVECVAGDGMCPFGCAMLDPDCDTTCGDGVCVGNAGELCTSCPADCRTRDVVCGNGQCQSGEAPECYADCGPSPWTWVTEEGQLFARINEKRVNGHACPNAAMVTAPALTSQPAMLPLAREWVWEISHQRWVAQGGVSCNGRTVNDRAMQTSFLYEAEGRGYASVDEAIDGWFSHAVICPRLMSSSYTQMSTAVALDALDAYLVLLR